MKNKILYLFFCSYLSVFTAFSQKKINDYYLKFIIHNPTGEKMYVNVYDYVRYKPIDSLILNSDSIQIKLPINEPSVITIKIENNTKAFMINCGENIIMIDPNNISIWHLKNNNLNEINEEYEHEVSQPVRVKLFELMKLRQNMNNAKKLEDSINIAMSKIMDKQADQTRAFLRKYSSSFYALHILRYYYKSWDFDLVNNLYANLSPELKLFPSAIKIRNYLNVLKDSSAINRFPIDSLQFFSSISFNNHAKFYVIDFWGSWCKPCLAMLPMMKKTYAELNKKEIEFIGIACEKKTDKKILKNIVQKHKLNWPQTIQYFNDKNVPDVLNKYEVSAFPTYFLLDENYKIILRGIGEDGFNNIIKKILSY